MIPWNPTPTPATRRPIDRPAVAFILTVALVLGALAGLYAAHATAHRDDTSKVSSARTPIDYSRWDGTPVYVGPRPLCYTVAQRGRSDRALVNRPTHRRLCYVVGPHGTGTV